MRICRERGAIDWNTYAIVAVIELEEDARDLGGYDEELNSFALGRK